MQANTLVGWVVRGLGGAANMLGSFASDKIPIDNDHLKQLRSIVIQLASHYNYHAKRSAMEPSERPPFGGSDYPVGGVNFDGELESTQPAEVASGSTDAPAVEPTDADNKPN